MTYAYWTTLEVYDDGTSTRYLNSRLRLHNLNTFLFREDNSFVRMSVGWRNPQEDAYDVSSITFQYKLDQSLSTVECVDGYANGSISTSFYNANTQTDYLGRHNVTIKEWTDNIIPVTLPNGKIRNYRVPEPQQCELISSSISERPPLVVSPLDVK